MLTSTPYVHFADTICTYAIPTFYLDCANLVGLRTHMPDVHSALVQDRDEHMVENFLPPAPSFAPPSHAHIHTHTHTYIHTQIHNIIYTHTLLHKCTSHTDTQQVKKLLPHIEAGKCCVAVVHLKPPPSLITPYKLIQSLFKTVNLRWVQRIWKAWSNCWRNTTRSGNRRMGTRARAQLRRFDSSAFNRLNFSWVHFQKSNLIKRKQIYDCIHVCAITVYCPNYAF
jgi:hypothetical protein